MYEIHVSNNQTGEADVSYQFKFTTELQDDNTFLYNTGTITSLNDPNYNRRQYYDVYKKTGSGEPLGERIATHVPVPPCNIGIHSTPHYEANLGSKAVAPLTGGGQVFAGQRAEGFFADLGALFDLADIRPLQFLHTGPLAPAFPFDALQGLNINTIAIQVPKTHVTKGNIPPTDPLAATSVIGVYSSASRRQMRTYNATTGKSDSTGAYIQVSRLGNPLFKVLIPIAKKDAWNAAPPSGDSAFADRVLHPELAKLIPILYPLPFNNLRGYTKARADLAAILLTGIPKDVVSPNFQNYTGPVQADLLRLNLAIPPSSRPNNIGLIAGDPAGFPNGRRLDDDVVTIELRAIAGATIRLVDKTFTPDLATGVLSDFAGQTNGAFLPHFPYLGTPNSGFASAPKNHDTGPA